MSSRALAAGTGARCLLPHRCLCLPRPQKLATGPEQVTCIQRKVRPPSNAHFANWGSWPGDRVQWWQEKLRPRATGWGRHSSCPRRSLVTSRQMECVLRVGTAGDTRRGHSCLHLQSQPVAEPQVPCLPSGKVDLIAAQPAAMRPREKAVRHPRSSETLQFLQPQLLLTTARGSHWYLLGTCTGWPNWHSRPVRSQPPSHRELLRALKKPARGAQRGRAETPLP